MTIRHLTASAASARPLRLVGAASLDPVEGDGKSLRKFRMAAYNGGTYKFPWSSAPVVLDLAGLLISDKPRPILKDHDTAQVVGLGGLCGGGLHGGLDGDGHGSAGGLGLLGRVGGLGGFGLVSGRHGVKRLLEFGRGLGGEGGGVEPQRLEPVGEVHGLSFLNGGG